MAKGGCRSGVCEVISRHVHGLNGSDGSVFGGSDSLLHGAHIGSEGRLVSNGRRDTSEKCGDFGTRLCKAEDIVDKEEDVLFFLVAEVFGLGKSGETDACTSSRRFVHLSVNQGDFGVSVKVDDTGFDHFVVEVIAFTCTFSDTGEDGKAAMSFGDIVDEFHNEDGFSDTGTAEESDFSAFRVGGEEVDDFNAGDELFCFCGLVGESWGQGVDGSLGSGFDFASFVDGFSNDIHDASQGFFSDGDGDGFPGSGDFLSSYESFCCIHGDTADGIFAEVLCDFEYQALIFVGGLKSREDAG